MEIILNGEPKQMSEGLTVESLLAQLAIRPERVVVEVNVTILKRQQHPTTMLKPGDRVEIVHFVGGGADVRNRARLVVDCLESAV